MLRSMYSGIGGMKNFQIKLDVIGNNIANVNTYGFKKGRVTFKDLMSQTISGASRPNLFTGGKNPKQVGLGATLATIDTVDIQGSLQTTGRVLDVGINGDGYFVVAQGNNTLYTRAGNFYLDANGTLVTADGFRVQGYLVRNGVVDYNTITDIVLDTNTVMPPKATTYVKFAGNLNAEAPVYEQANPETAKGKVEIGYKVKDSIGRDISLKLTFTKTADNEWAFQVTTSDDKVDWDSLAGQTDEDGDGTNDYGTFQIKDYLQTPPAVVGNPVLKFKDGFIQIDDGNDPPTTLSYPNVSIDIPLKDGGTQTINLDLSKITQFASSTTAGIDTMDGNSEGYLESFNIGESGEVNGVFSNGEVLVMGQLTLATFSNNGGLTKVGGNYFQSSNNSGLPNFGVAGEGRGTLQSGALEMSNVDLSEEFTEMIVAQRGFQANTRIITTSDQILEELVNLKR
jgi:flagellar hook protein FlgE